MIKALKKELNDKGIIVLSVRVRPSAPITRFVVMSISGMLKIDVSAPKEKNKANKALIKFLAKEFVVAPNYIKIIKGKHSRNKLIKIKK